jgi:hypothetical protein
MELVSYYYNVILDSYMNKNYVFELCIYLTEGDRNILKIYL